MKLISINIRKKHMVGLEIEPEPELESAPRDAAGLIAIDLDLYLDLGLKEGMEISLSELLEILEESEYRRARARALWNLSAKEYPEKELYLKLKKEFSDSAANRVIENLKELDILNDRRYAEMYARRLIEIKKTPPSVAPYLMAEKGIDKDLAKEVVDTRGDDPREMIKEMIEKKYLKELAQNGGRDKTIARLSRKGFKIGDIRAVLNELRISENDGEDYGC